MDNLVNQYIINGGLITVLAGVLGFFIRKWIMNVEEDFEKLKDKVDANRELSEKNERYLFEKTDQRLSEVVDKFQDIAINIKDTVTEMKNIVDVFKTQTEMTNKEVDRRLNAKRQWLEEHDHKLDEHEKRITTVETTCKYQHKIK